MASSSSNIYGHWRLPRATGSIQSKDVITSFICNKLASYTVQPLKLDVGYEFKNYAGHHVEKSIELYLTQYFDTYKHLLLKMDDFYTQYDNYNERFGKIYPRLAQIYFLNAVNFLAPNDQWPSTLNTICLTWKMVEKAHVQGYGEELIVQFVKWLVEYFAEMRDESVKKEGGWEDVKVMKY